MNQNHNKFTVNDFFCGCGGMGLGFKQAGFTIAGAWDCDKYAAETYRANVGDHVKLADITQLTIADIPKADVWAFGFPCQDLSYAGKQGGMEMECGGCGAIWKMNLQNRSCPECQSENFRAANRSGLFFEMMRLLDEAGKSEKRPLILLAENVKALKPYLPVIKEEYAKRGYRAYATLLNSKFWGVPQNRERYFVVGICGRISEEFLFPVEQHEHIPKLSSVLETDADEKFYIPDAKAKAIIEQALEKLEILNGCRATITPGRAAKRQNGRRAKDEEEAMFTLTAQDVHGVIVDDSHRSRGPRIYKINPTLRTCGGVKVIEGKGASNETAA